MLLPRSMKTSESGLLPGAMSGSMSLPQPQTVLMSLASVTTESSENKAAQSMFCLSLAATIRKTGPDLTSCTTLESGLHTSPGQHSSPPLPPSSGGKSWSWDHRSGQGDPNPRSLYLSGERALNLARAV